MLPITSATRASACSWVIRSFFTCPASWPWVTARAFSSAASTNFWSMSLTTTGMSAAGMARAISPPIAPPPTTAALLTNIRLDPSLILWFSRLGRVAGGRPSWEAICMDDEAARSETRERDELLAFELGLDERVVDEVHRLPWGRLFLSPSTPLIWDSNWVAIEQVGLTVDQLVAIADDALGSEGFGHRTIGFVDQADGRRVRETVEAQQARWPRWEVEQTRYMVWRGGPVPVSSQKPADSAGKCELTGQAGAREVRLAEIEGLRKALIDESMAAHGGGGA